MKNTKLISLLSTFNLAEWRKFEEYLKSPFFNKRADLIAYGSYLKELFPDFAEEQLEETAVFKIIYPNQIFDHRMMVYLNSYMLKQAERFLAEICLDKKTYWINTYVMEELMDRKLNKQFGYYLQKTESLLKTNTFKTSDFFYFQYYLADLEKRSFFEQNKRKQHPSIQKNWNYLNDFYFHSKLKAACEMLEWKNIISVNYEMPFIEEVISHLQKYKDALSPNNLIYLTAYTLLTEKASKTNFLAFKHLIQQHLAILPNSEKQYLYQLATNFCTQQIKHRNEPYYYVEECLALCMEGIEKEFLLVNNYIDPWIFKNVVKLGFNLKRFDWTEQFIQQYHTQLEPIFQEDALHYNLADLFYRRKKYGIAQQHLFQVEYSDIFYNLGAKTMLLKIYFELDEEEALLSNLASFTIFLKRNKKITGEIRLVYLNFTKLLYRLLRAKPTKIEKILADINQIDLLANRSWLLAVANTLKK